MLRIIIETYVYSKINKAIKHKIKKSYDAVPISTDTILARYEGIFQAAYIDDKELVLKMLMPRINMVLLEHMNTVVYGLDKGHIQASRYPYVCNKISDNNSIIINDAAKFVAVDSSIIRHIMDHGDIYFLGVTLMGNMVIKSINKYILVNDILLSCDSYQIETDGFADVESMFYPIDRIPLASESTVVLKRKNKEMTVKVKNIRAFNHESMELYYWNGFIFANHPEPSVYHPIINMYDVGCILMPIYCEDMSYFYLLDRKSFIYKINGNLIKSPSDLNEAKYITVIYKGNEIRI